MCPDGAETFKGLDYLPDQAGTPESRLKMVKYIYWGPDGRWRTCPIDMRPDLADPELCSNRFAKQGSGIIYKDSPPGYEPPVWDYIRRRWYSCPEGMFMLPDNKGTPFFLYPNDSKMSRLSILNYPGNSDQIQCIGEQRPDKKYPALMYPQH